jgi:FkbM family methyltransferase
MLNSMHKTMNISKVFSYLPQFLRRHKLVNLLLYLSPQSKIQLVKFNDSSELYADISNIYYRNYFVTRSFHPYFFSIVKPFLKKGGVFFDVGANFGFCSFGVMGSLPKANIEYHLFEANNTICQILSKSAERYTDKKIKINNCCVSDRIGISKLKIVKEQLGMSFISTQGEVEVPNLCLDRYIKENGIKKVNLLKIDIEGWEVFALKGIAQSLNSGLVDAVYIEISPQFLSRNGFTPEDCFGILRSAKFSLFYCKESDFKADFLIGYKTEYWNINDHLMQLVPLDNFPNNYHTDIIAIHDSLLGK